MLPDKFDGVGDILNPEDAAEIRQVLGQSVPLAGFYDYGEQAPLTATGFRGLSYFHNETLVVCAVSAG